MLLALTTVLPPGNYGKIIHYSYPAAAIIAILFVTALQEIWSVRLIAIILITITLIHLALLPKAVYTTSRGLENYLFPDKTVTKEEINMIKNFVVELKEKGSSASFEGFNNGEELDFSGTWFYSKKKSNGRDSVPYFPVEGTVRVLLWPDKIKTVSSKRIFDFKSPTYKDIK
jgi:hypothetical protein